MPQNLCRYQARRSDEDTEVGFTLIELLIVIVVLGILAAVTVFALSGTTTKSAVSACNSDAATVNTAVAAYDANTGFITGSTASSTNVAPTSALLVPTYLQSFPVTTNGYAVTISSATATLGAVFVAAPAAGTAVAWTPGSAACALA